MMKFTAIASLPAVALASVHSNRNFLGADMRPDVVAHTLVRVENGWMKDATEFAHCTADSGECAGFSQAFSKSCSQVVSGVVQGSNGERERTQEYMADVCGQNSISGWHKATCLSLRSALSEKMTESSFDNRESLDVSKICEVAWTALVEEQKVVVAKELAKRQAAEKKMVEAAAKEAEEQKAAQTRAAAAAITEAKEAEEKAEAKEKEIKKEEADKKQEEAQEKKTEDEKAKLEDQKFQDTKAQIEAVERAADQKMAEATAVEREDVSAVTPPKPAAKAAVPVPAAKAAAPKAAVVKVAVTPKPAAAIVAPKEMHPAVAKMAVNVANILAKAKTEKPVAAQVVKAPVVAKAPVAQAPVKKALTVLQQIKARGITDPCSGITCSANLKCPAGFAVTEVEGHCCPYCVNPNIKLEAAITGATGSAGGKASTFCPKVWCFPTACTKPLSNPTTTNGACCATCPA